MNININIKLVEEQEIRYYYIFCHYMIQQTIYLLLTVFIPLRMSYHATRHNDKQSQKLWAVYWALYSGFKSLQWNCWLLEYKVVDFVFILLALWLYNDSYKGALYLADFITHMTQKTPAVANVINIIRDKLKFVPLFESPTVVTSVPDQKKVQ